MAKPAVIAATAAAAASDHQQTQKEAETGQQKNQKARILKPAAAWVVAVDQKRKEEAKKQQEKLQFQRRLVTRIQEMPELGLIADELKKVVKKEASASPEKDVMEPIIDRLSLAAKNDDLENHVKDLSDFVSWTRRKIYSGIMTYGELSAHLFEIQSEILYIIPEATRRAVKGNLLRHPDPNSEAEIDHKILHFFLWALEDDLLPEAVIFTLRSSIESDSSEQSAEVIQALKTNSYVQFLQASFEGHINKITPATLEQFILSQLSQPDALIPNIRKEFYISDNLGNAADASSLYNLNAKLENLGANLNEEDQKLIQEAQNQVIKIRTARIMKSINHVLNPEVFKNLVANCGVEILTAADLQRFPVQLFEEDAKSSAKEAFQADAKSLANHTAAAQDNGAAAATAAAPAVSVVATDVKKVNGGKGSSGVELQQG